MSSLASTEWLEAEVDPELRDVPGPSALGGGLRRAWELLC